MLYFCVRDVMDVVFSVGIVRRGAVGTRVWDGKCECFVMHMLYVCVLCVSCAAFCMLMLLEDARGDHMSSKRHSLQAV